MKNFIENLLAYRIIAGILTILLLGLSLFAIPKVDINSDIFSYMPDGVESMETASVLAEEFNDPGTFQLLFIDATETEVDTYITEFMTLSYDGKNFVSSVKLVQKLDDTNDYLYNLVLTDDSNWNSDQILEVVDLIEGVFIEQDIEGGVVSGTVIIPFVVENMIILSVIVVAVMILLMVLFTPSYLEPVLILASIGIAVLLNMGSNIIMRGGVSNITFSVASLIQLAVSIDYSLILLGSYKKLRDEKSDVDDAISSAVATSIKPILTGSVTTIAGFMALAAMQFEIGRDLGLVLAKGIAISLLVTILVLPVLIRLTSGLHSKLEHREFMPGFGSIGKFVSTKVSVSLVILLFSVGILGGVAKLNMDFLYGEPPMESNSLYIQENFDEDNQIVVVFDNDGVDIGAKDAFISGLSNIDGLVATDLASGKFTYMDYDNTFNMAYNIAYQASYTDIYNLVTVCSLDSDALSECASIPSELLIAINAGYITIDQATTTILETMVDAEVKGQFISENNVERIIVYIDDPNNEFESEKIFDTVAAVRALAKDTLGEDAFVTGESAMLYDMMLITEEDNTIVNILSVTSVALILLIMFRSWSIPIILIVTIQSAILINIGLSFLTGVPLSFLGVVIISSVQLGATIDYTVLLTEKYQHARIKKGLDKQESAIYAVDHSSHTLLTSGLSLTACGFIMTFFFVGTTAELGLLLGRGGLISLLVSFLLMPHILYIFDRLIIGKKRA